MSLQRDQRLDRENNTDRLGSEDDSDQMELTTYVTDEPKLCSECNSTLPSAALPRYSEKLVEDVMAEVGFFYRNTDTDRLLCVACYENLIRSHVRMVAISVDMNERPPEDDGPRDDVK
jgi:hypothetical protein